MNLNFYRERTNQWQVSLQLWRLIISNWWWKRIRAKWNENCWSARYQFRCKCTAFVCVRNFFFPTPACVFECKAVHFCNQIQFPLSVSLTLSCSFMTMLTHTNLQPLATLSPYLLTILMRMSCTKKWLECEIWLPKGTWWHTNLHCKFLIENLHFPSSDFWPRKKSLTHANLKCTQMKNVSIKLIKSN